MAELATGDAVVLDVQLAQLPVRAVAKLIDVIGQLVLAGLSLCLLCSGLFVTAGFGSADPIWGVVGVLALVLVVLVGYPVLYETSSRGRTLGKAAMGLRVVSEDGGPIRFRQALVRGLMAVFEIYSFGAAPAVLSALASAKGKRIGDIFAGTIVISERGERVPPPMPMGLAPWAGALSLGGVSTELALLAQQYLRRSRELRPQVSHALGERIAQEVAASVSPPPPAGMPAQVVIVTVLAERHRREWLRYLGESGRRDALRARQEQLLGAEAAGRP